MDSLPQLALDFDAPPLFPPNQCRACGETKPLTEFGLVPRRHFPGEHLPDTRCKVCRREYHRQWRLRNPEAVHAIQTRHAERKKEFPKPLPAEKTCTICHEKLPIDRFGSAGKGQGLLPRCKACRAAKARRQIAQDPEKRREYLRLWRAANPDKVRAMKRRGYVSRPEERSKERRKHYQKNRARYRAHADSYRARKFNAPIVEVIDRQSIIDRDKSTCYLCGKAPADDIRLDHVIPLSRGGNHAADNLRVACAMCNARKSNLLLSELTWYQPQVL